MDKIYQLILETLFNGDKNFEVFPHRTKDGARQHLQKLLDEIISTTKYKVYDRRSVNHDEKIYAEDDDENYVFLNIVEVDVLN